MTEKKAGVFILLVLEVEQHLLEIKRVNMDIEHNKNTFKKNYESLNEDDPEKWGIIYESCDRICKLLSTKRKLEGLIEVKNEMINRGNEKLQQNNN